MSGTKLSRIMYVRNIIRKDHVCQEHNYEGSSMSRTELGRITCVRNIC